MIENNSSKDNIELSLINYDTDGAMIYMIIVILWYSIGIVFLLGMDILSRSEEIEDSARRRARFLIRNLRDHTNTKEILEELVDRKKRDRLWGIYLGTKWDKKKDRVHRAETMRIRHIEKQLATIRRDHRSTHDVFSSTTNGTRYSRSRSDYRPETSHRSSEATTTLRRSSSLDQQTFERWNELKNLSKHCEQLSWPIPKLMIGKYFQRSIKKTSLFRLKRSNTTIPTVDNEKIDLISFSNQYRKLSHGKTEANLSTTTSSINERQNPYMSYFYIPPTHPINFTLERFPSE